MSLAYSAFYDENFDDAPGFIDAAAERSQKIADLKAELIAEAKTGSATFWGYMHESVYLAVQKAFTSNLPDVDRWRLVAAAVQRELDAQAQAIAEDE